MKPTSKHIADHALKLFNRQGVVNVRLQHIADAAFVSVGHLAYHFKNKEAFIHYLFEQHRQAGQTLLQAYRVLPLFQDVDRMLSELYLLQDAFSFLYTDILELVRAYPALLPKYSEYAGWQRMQLELMLEFQVARGAMHMPNAAVSVGFVAQSLQQHLDTWRYRQLTTGPQHMGFEKFCNDTWQLLLPYCSPQGLQELQVS